MHIKQPLLFNDTLRVSFGFNFIVLSIGEKIGDNSSDNDLKSPIESSNKLDTANGICEFKPSKFMCFKRGILLVFSWITCFFRIWNIFSYCSLSRFRKREIFDT